MSAETICWRATRFGFTLLGNEFAIDARQHVVRQLSAIRKSIMWVRSGDHSLVVANPAHLEDYISLLTNQQYSYLMADGGIIQIAYTFNRERIERHRLAYYPCPFPITGRDISAYGEMGILDLINDQYMTEIEENVLLRSPIRFDYSPEAAAKFHPASHITLNDPSCRIPARAPLNFDTFIQFILENFYPDAWQSKMVVRELTFSNEEDCLSDHDRGRAYLHWVHRPTA
jgi:hypothetical protein